MHSRIRMPLRPASSLLAAALALAVGFAAPSHAQEAPDGSTVLHKPFNPEDPNTYPLRKFNGRHTSLLISQKHLDSVGLARVRKSIDDHDAIYAAFKAFMRDDPQGAPEREGSGLPRVSVYEKACKNACALSIGWKGIEVDTNYFNKDIYLPTLVHEFAHSFDFYSPIIFAGPEGKHGHEWTAFMEQLIQLHLGMSQRGLNASDYFDYQVRTKFEPYETLPGASWERCIRELDCSDAGHDGLWMSENAQGGALLRVTQLYGAAAMKDWVPTLKALIAERGTWWGSPAEEKSEVLIESLSRTLKADMSCFFDHWKWPMSAALRSRMAVRGNNPYCADADNDGFSRLRYDCDDASSSIRPGAAETANGKDDDCNGAVDDLLLAETSPFPDSRANPLPITAPVRIVGSAPSFSGNVSDCFRLSLNTAETFQVTLKSKGTFQGWVQIRRPGSEEDYAMGWVPPAHLDTYKASLPAGEWDLLVTVDQIDHAAAHGGEYEVVVKKSYPFFQEADLTPITFTPAVAQASGINRYALPVPPIPTSLAGRSGLTARFWISGFGEVGSLPATSSSPFQWSAPAGTDPHGLTYRVGYHVGGLPVHPWSQRQSLPGSIDWRSQDIGPVGTAGTLAKFGERNLAVSASGADIWGTSDAFRFTWLPLHGNGEAVAKVLTLRNTHSYIKAGAMMRENLTAGSRNVFAALTQSGNAMLQVRSAAGGTTVSTKVPASGPLWVKLARQGDVFTAFTSTDGAAWTQLGSPTTLVLPASLHAGLAVTSHDNAQVTRAGFAHAAVVSTALTLSGKVATPKGAGVPGMTVSLTGDRTATATTDAAGNYSFTGLRQFSNLTVTPAKAGTLCAPAHRAFPLLKASGTGVFTAWNSGDIGSVGLAGSASFASDTYTLRGAGADIWGTADAFRFVHSPLTGDGQITARVTSVQNTNAWAKAGVMIREDLTAGSRNAFMLVTPASGVSFQRRTTAGGTTVSSLRSGAAPQWVRVSRVGLVLTGSVSSDGVNWSQVGSVSMTLGTTVYVGLAVTSHNNAALCTAAFQNVSAN